MKAMNCNVITFKKKGNDFFMSKTYLPTKNNLIKLANTIKQHKNGQSILDKKILILKKKIEQYKKEQEELLAKIKIILTNAENTLKKAIVDVGFDELIDITNSIKDDDTINIKALSLMGVEIPSIVSDNTKVTLNYGLYHTTSNVDESIIRFIEVKNEIIKLAEIQNTIIRLQTEIGKVERRSNALKEVIIPKDEALSKKIANYLEETERDEFIRLKMLKQWIVVTV